MCSSVQLPLSAAGSRSCGDDETPCWPSARWKVAAGNAKLRVILWQRRMAIRNSVYEPLCQRLLRESGKHLQLTFSEIEGNPRKKAPGVGKFSAWWSNESSIKVGHTQAPKHG